MERKLTETEIDSLVLEIVVPEAFLLKTGNQVREAALRHPASISAIFCPATSAQDIWIEDEDRSSGPLPSCGRHVVGVAPRLYFGLGAGLGEGIPLVAETSAGNLSSTCSHGEPCTTCDKVVREIVLCR